MAGDWLAIGWLLAIYGLAMGWPWAGIDAGHGLAMGGLSAIYELTIGSPSFDTITIVFKY